MPPNEHNCLLHIFTLHLASTKATMNWDTNAWWKSIYTKKNNASTQPNQIILSKTMWIHLTLLLGVYKQLPKVAYKQFHIQNPQTGEWLYLYSPRQADSPSGWCLPSSFPLSYVEVPDQKGKIRLLFRVTIDIKLEIQVLQCLILKKLPGNRQEEFLTWKGGRPSIKTRQNILEVWEVAEVLVTASYNPWGSW